MEITAFLESIETERSVKVKYWMSKKSTSMCLPFENGCLREAT